MSLTYYVFLRVCLSHRIMMIEMLTITRMKVTLSFQIHSNGGPSGGWKFTRTFTRLRPAGTSFNYWTTVKSSIGLGAKDYFKFMQTYGKAESCPVTKHNGKKTNHSIYGHLAA